VTTSDIDAIQPAWTPDGAGITFSRDGALVTIQNGEESDLTSGENNDSAPAWRPVPPK
jgi:Tol biopolymer transport system component